jgi:tyrosyl-tRNA synthetase
MEETKNTGLATLAPDVREAGIQEVLERAVAIVEVREDLEKLLRGDRRLRVKLGIDPTGPRIHIGRAVPLRKMRQFQLLGHQAVLVVGDFTARLGDASDKDATRPQLSAEVVRENMRHYEQQIGMVIDVDQAEFRYNSEWLEGMNFSDVVRLASHFTVAQMIQRENFSDRWEAGNPIGLHELLYPLMQGYDSVALGNDVELGSTDQLFNVMAGRKLQPVFGQPPQQILLTNMIMGTDGRKMSTSWGNTIFINDAPNDLFGKVMSISDPMIVPYLESCTSVPMAEVWRTADDLATGNAHPNEVKKHLAWAVVREYHGQAAADEALAEWNRVRSGRELPSDIPAVRVRDEEIGIVDLLLLTGVEPSKNQARRDIDQGGVSLNGQRITSAQERITPRDGDVLRVGKLRFVRLEVQ